MKTNMTGLRWFSKILVLWTKAASALEGLITLSCLVITLSCHIHIYIYIYIFILAIEDCLGALGEGSRNYTNHHHIPTCCMLQYLSC